jgi:hypothetical protein
MTWKRIREKALWSELLEQWFSSALMKGQTNCTFMCIAFSFIFWIIGVSV